MGTRFLEFPEFDGPIEVVYGPLDLSTWAKIRRAADLYGPGCSIDREQIASAVLEYAFTSDMREDFEHYFALSRRHPGLIPLHYMLGELETRVVDEATK